MNANGQWARVPEWVAYKDLDATAWNVLVILASKAGPDRVAWISHRTIGDRLGMHPTTAGRAIRRLEKVGVIEEAGKVMVNHEDGTWVKRYRIVDRSPDLPEVRLERTSAQRSDQREVRLERISGQIGADIAPTEVRLEGPEVRLGLPEVRPGRRHSVPQYSVPQISVPLLDAQLGNERDPNPKGRTNPSMKENPVPT
jgi:DNA-binding MarR family transcriptional regulator